MRRGIGGGKVLYAEPLSKEQLDIMRKMEIEYLKGETKMSKFKVGDKVEYTGTLSPDFIGKQGVITMLGTLAHWVDFGPSGERHVLHENITLANSSPIRTVTATEIVAGKYGRIDIEAVTGRIIMRIIDPLRFHTAEDIRESGEILLKLADALDGGAKVVAK